LFDLNHDVDRYKFKINSEWAGTNVGYIDSKENYFIEKSRVYILPDSWGCPNQSDWIHGKFIITQDLPTIEASNSHQSYAELDQWLQVNEFDALKRKRDYFPCIDKYMIEIADSSNYLDKIAGLILCGKDGDGAYGLQAIKKAGGETAVQIPGECCGLGSTDSMPKTALNLEPSHRQISLENPCSEFSLTKWLLDIK
jgi:hypothetical protein